MRRYVIGGIIGAALTIGITAHAEVSGMIGKVVDGVFPVNVEGELMDNEAIVIQGTSYLPVREFVEKLGYEVSFDMVEGIGLSAAEEAKEQEPIEEEHVIEPDPKTEAPVEEVPSLESYNVRINQLETLLSVDERWGSLGEEAESYRQEKSRLEVERAQHYPDWDK